MSKLTETLYKDILAIKAFDEVFSEGSADILTDENLKKKIEEKVKGYLINPEGYRFRAPSISYRDYSSSSHFNSINKDLERDLIVAYEALISLLKKNDIYHNRWKYALEDLNSQLDILLDKTQNVLLEVENFEDPGNSIQERLVNLQNIDKANSTTSIDLSSHVVSIPRNISQSTSRLNLSNLTSKDIQANIFVKSNSIRRRSPLSGSKSKNIVDGYIYSIWGESIATIDQKTTLTGEIIIDLKELKSFSRADVSLHGSNSSNNIIINVQYSADGASYYTVPSTTPSQSTKTKASFLFSSISARYLKIILFKASYDYKDNEGNYVYELGLEDISLYMSDFSANLNMDFYFYSSDLQILDKSKNPKYFSKLKFDICDQIPDNTSINYYFADSDADFIDISSANWKPLDKERELVLSRKEEYENNSISLSAFEGTTSWDELSYLSDFIFVSKTNINNTFLPEQFSRCLNLRLAKTNPISYNPFDIVLCRNVGDSSNSVVREGVRGWGFDDPYYSCIINIEKEKVTIDLGDDIEAEDLFIDGKETLGGSKELKAGYHSIRIKREKWEEKRSLFEQAGTYFEYLMQYVRSIDFYSSVADNDFRVFTVDKDLLGNEIFVVKVNDKLSAEKEIFSLKIFHEDKTSKTFRIKAILNTEDSRLTPYFTSYRLKFV